MDWAFFSVNGLGWICQKFLWKNSQIDRWSERKEEKKNSKEIRVELLRIWKPISKLEEKPFETMTFEFCRLNQTDFVEFSATEFHALLQPETWF